MYHMPHIAYDTNLIISQQPYEVDILIILTFQMTKQAQRCMDLLLISSRAGIQIQVLILFITASSMPSTQKGLN